MGFMHKRTKTLHIETITGNSICPSAIPWQGSKKQTLWKRYVCETLIPQKLPFFDKYLMLTVADDLDHSTKGKVWRQGVHQ